MGELSEQELVQGCLGGNRRCQEDLYARFARRMYAVCLRYARHELEAQDLMQEGFIRVFEKLPSFRMEGSLEGWLRIMVQHPSLNHYRKKAFQQERFGMEHPPEAPVDPLAMDNLGEMELMAIIAELPDGYTTIQPVRHRRLRPFGDRTMSLGCGESTSRSQLSKARNYLQKRIERKDILQYAGKSSPLTISSNEPCSTQRLLHRRRCETHLAMNWGGRTLRAAQWVLCLCFCFC